MFTHARTQREGPRYVMKGQNQGSHFVVVYYVDIGEKLPSVPLGPIFVGGMIFGLFVKNDPEMSQNCSYFTKIRGTFGKGRGGAMAPLALLRSGLIHLCICKSTYRTCMKLYVNIIQLTYMYILGHTLQQIFLWTNQETSTLT